MRAIKLDAYEAEIIGFANEIVFYLTKSGVAIEDAKDVTQDVLVQMLESDLILPHEKVRAWMYRVAVRKYIDRFRRHQNYLDILQKEFFKTENVIEKNPSDFNPLYEAMITLPEQYRIIIDLFYFQDFSIKEICHILSLSESKVKVTLMRGRRKLKQQLEMEGYYYEDFNGF
ncbi:RNA polymerase sigma factor [Streptococcus pluranimalium]